MYIKLYENIEMIILISLYHPSVKYNNCYLIVIHCLHFNCLNNNTCKRLDIECYHSYFSKYICRS